MISLVLTSENSIEKRSNGKKTVAVNSDKLSFLFRGTLISNYFLETFPIPGTQYFIKEKGNQKKNGNSNQRILLNLEPNSQN